MKDTFSHCDKI